MKPKFRSLAAAFSPATRGTLIICATLCSSAAVNAASQTWDGDTDANWTTAGNWVGGAVPGINPTANNTNSGDVATFNAPINGITLAGSSTNPVINDGTAGNISSNRMIGRLVFDTANAGAYHIGASGSTTTLQMVNNAAGGTGTFIYNVDVASTVVNSQTINAPIALHLPSSTNGFGSVRNNATDSNVVVTLAGGILNSPNSTRGSRWALFGTNTGNNIISGTVTLSNSGGQSSQIIKNESGLWILSGANTIGGGVIVNAGTLVAQSATAFGAAGLTVNGGLARIDGGITLANNNVTLESAAEIRSNGSNGINKLTLSATATTPVISTVSSSDVFTIGNTTNTITGGSATTSLNVNGPGTISIPMPNNYVGAWQINSGTVLLGNGSALGSPTATKVSFGASSTATLRLFGYSPTIVGLNTDAVTGTPVIDNGDIFDSILTVNTSGTDTYAGTLTDGSTGKLGLTKGGTGTLTLSGTNTYTGDTVVNNGTLKINSAASTPNVAVNSGATLGGIGSITGAVTINNLGHLAPGNSVGTLTAGSLTVESGAVLDYEFGTGNDLAVVTGSGGLTLNGGGINLYQDGTTNQFATVGSYNLFQYNGALNGSAGNLSVLNPDPTKNYAFSANGSNVVLDITAAVISQWNLATGGSWASAGSWSGSGVPNASGATALFGSALTSPGTVTLDGSKTVATVAFDNTNSYTIAPASTESLIFSSPGQAQITGTNGSHQISAPITLNSNTVSSVANSADTITLSGIISGSGNLTKSGAGTLALSGANDFTGNVTISAGSLSFGSGSLGAGTSLSMGGSTLVWASGNTDDVSDGGNRTVEFLPGNSTWNTNGNDVIIAGPVGNSGPGNLIKAGSGNLTLAGANSYTGTTAINGGKLTITSDSSLGAVPGSATPDSLVINSATLATSGIFTISGNRGVTLGSSTSTVETEAASNAICASVIAGSGKLNVTGSGIFDLAATNTYTGGTIINTGATLNLSGTGTPGTAQVALAGGTLTVNRNNYMEDDILIDTAQTGTIDGLADRVGVRGLTGSGDVTLITRFGGNNATSSAFGFRFMGNHAGFTGTINLKSGTGTVNTFTAYFNGAGANNFDGSLGNATINMTDFARFSGVNNSNGNTVTIGALSGDSTAILSGADYAGTQTYNIGGKGLDTTFAGIIDNGSAGNANIIKSGTGKLTLTGANTYFGTTAVNAGTLAVESATALGADTTGTTIAGGDVDAKVTVTGGIIVSEPWTLSGRQGINQDSPSIVSLSGNNTLSGLVSPATGGDRYSVQCDAGALTVSGGFLPAGAVTGTRYLQLFGNGNGEWSGAIQNGTATVYVNLMSTGTWTFSGVNDYTGDTMVESGASLVLSSTGHLKFAPTANGLSNLILGSGSATLDGVFDIDLTSADITDDNSWQLVAVNSASYGSNFSVAGFTQSGTSWTKTTGASTWTFEQTTGMLSVDTLPGYSSWISTFGLTGGDSAADFDYDKDGISNGIEYVIGGDPANANDSDKLPTLTKVPGGFEFVYRRTDLSSSDNPTVQHDADLAGTWTTAVNGVGGVTITASNDFFGAAVDKVTVFIPTTDPKHFARLNVVVP